MTGDEYVVYTIFLLAGVGLITISYFIGDMIVKVILHYFGDYLVRQLERLYKTLDW